VTRWPKRRPIQVALLSSLKNVDRNQLYIILPVIAVLCMVFFVAVCVSPG
jgi:hypothetical protein